ncbi:Uncharacterised protein [Vibrio cholerae]|nr:Uncharacterised protein [Vibrio cholerae]
MRIRVLNISRCVLWYPSDMNTVIFITRHSIVIVFGHINFRLDQNTDRLFHLANMTIIFSHNHRCLDINIGCR